MICVHIVVQSYTTSPGTVPCLGTACSLNLHCAQEIPTARILSSHQFRTSCRSVRAMRPPGKLVIRQAIPIIMPGPMSKITGGPFLAMAAEGESR